MNLQENIQRIREMMEGKDAYVERARFDQEYEEEYPKWKKSIIKLLESEIDSMAEINNGKIIVLLNGKNFTLCKVFIFW